MAYVLNADLTDEYIQMLIARNGYVDVTAQYPDIVTNFGAMYVVQDLEGSLEIFNNMSGVRTAMINAYVLIQNG